MYVCASLLGLFDKNKSSTRRAFSLLSLKVMAFPLVFPSVTARTVATECIKLMKQLHLKTICYYCPLTCLFLLNGQSILIQIPSLVSHHCVGSLTAYSWSSEPLNIAVEEIR